MNVLTYKDYSARVEFDADDMLLVGRIAGIKDVIGFHGTRPEELVAAFHDAVDDYLDACARIGKVPDKAYSGSVMLRVDPALHARAAVQAQLKGLSLNQWGEQALSKALASQAA